MGRVRSRFVLMRVTFFAPAPWETLSGGYVYDRAIVAELIAAGNDVEIVALPGEHPLADDIARAAAEAAWASLPPGAIPVIDGLCLPAFAAVADTLAARGGVGLIHHPTALETGRIEEARDALLAVERKMFQSLARIVVTSTDTSKRLTTQFGVTAARITVVEPGTPAVSRSAGPLREDCAILSVATLSPRKGHDVLLRALSRLLDLDWTLVIAGAAPDLAYGESLRRLMVDLALESRVRFVGEITPDALAPLWEGASMFALATWYEGFGMAIAEALRRGLPVAVTSGGAAAALVTPACGVICAPGDHAQLSRAMRRVIYDRPLRASMSDAAWQVGSALPDWAAQGEKFAAVLEAA